MNLHPMKDWSSLSAKLRLPTGCPVGGNILKGYQRLDERAIACHNRLWELNWANLWGGYYVTGPHSVNRTSTTSPMPPRKFPKFGKKSQHTARSSSSQSSPPPDSMSDIAWSGLLSTLPIVQQSLGGVPVPGLPIAVVGFIHIHS